MNVRSIRKILIFVIGFVAYAMPVWKLVTESRSLEKIVISFMGSTIVFVTLGLAILLLTYVLQWLVDKFPDDLTDPVLPPNAFEVQINFSRTVLLSLVLTVGSGLVTYFAARSLGHDPYVGPLTLIVYLFVLVVLHEGCHALAWILGGMPPRTISFGIFWRYLSPYAHCTEAMSVRLFRVVLVIPLILTGFLPLALGLWLGDLTLQIASAFLIGGAAGDLAMLASSVAFHPDVRVMDHPTKPAFIVLDKGNLPTFDSNLSSSA